MAGDLSDDLLEVVLKEHMDVHVAIMSEIEANAESAHSLVRHAGGRKFNQEDPIEGAAVEMILGPPSGVTQKKE